RLHELGETVVVVERDRDNEFVARLPEVISVIYGDAFQPQRMHEAGFERARAVLALTGEDRVNLRIAQRAKSLAPHVKMIGRLFDSTLASRLDASLFGIDLAINPAQVVASAFASASTPDPWEADKRHRGSEMELVTAFD